MSLQRLRRLATAPVLSDGGLLVALRSKLNHELTNQSLKEAILPLGFSVEHDIVSSKDMFLRWRDGSSGESVVVSALLSQLCFNGDDALSQEVSMKVCVENPSFGPVLRFDCNVFDTSVAGGLPLSLIVASGMGFNHLLPLPSS